MWLKSLVLGVSDRSYQDILPGSTLSSKMVTSGSIRQDGDDRNVKNEIDKPMGDISVAPFTYI